MQTRTSDVAPLRSEVSEMIEPEIIRQIREFADRGWGSKCVFRQV